jgi:hypothetical protein
MGLTPVLLWKSGREKRVQEKCRLPSKSPMYATAGA